MAHPTDPNCIFCKIVAGTIPCFRLHDDAQTIAFMDINPANEGHALSVAKGHWPTVHDIPADVLGAVAQTAQRVSKAVHKTLNPEGINLIQANGPGAAQSVPHLHIHVLPRWKTDNLAINWHPSPGDMAKIKALHERILANMG
ncbi:MAG: HIT domain-containing protein [Alphaproteobacteria bacterium]|nr:HIT domain-containing protein [Alphaproteobacteria bacterium]